jgi:hypothetical protein
MKTVGALAALAATQAIFVCGSSGASHKESVVRPPLLVPWQQIGDISLREPRRQVEQEYGSVGRGFHVVQRWSGAVQGWYRGVHGSKVFVTFYGRRVGTLGVGSPYYRTKSGFGVGSRIPLGRCHKPRIAPFGRCEYRWHTFVYNAWGHESPCGCWTKVGLGKESLPATVENFEKPWFIISVRHGRVTGFYFDLKYVD